MDSRAQAAYFNYKRLDDAEKSKIDGYIMGILSNNRNFIQLFEMLDGKEKLEIERAIKNQITE